MAEQNASTAIFVMKNTLSNARQISAAHSFSLLKFVFFQELSETELAAYKELVRQAKEAKTPANEPASPPETKSLPAPKPAPALTQEQRINKIYRDFHGKERK